MTQEFFTTTLISKYIKYLLANTPLPQYSFINENEDMIAGGVYVYKQHILKCTRSGRFTGINGTITQKTFLEAQENVRANDPFNTEGAANKDNMHLSASEYSLYAPQEGDIDKGWMALIKPDRENAAGYNTVDVIPLAATDDYLALQLYTPAEFKIIDTFLPESYKPGVTQTFESNTSYYDTDTHAHLGEYLRYLKNMYDLDLMGLYNCYGHYVIRNMVLSSRVNNKNEVVVKISDENNVKNKVLLVPIKFNRTYTIAFDTDTPVQMSAVLYNKKLIMNSRKQYHLYETLNEKVNVYNNLKFSHPITYRVKSPSADIHQYERYLYLAVQVSASNNSTLTVLEGDYSSNGTRVVSDIIGLKDGEGTVNRLSSMMISNLSLLEKSTIQRPFAEKLIEYLTGNTIDTREQIDENVQTIIKQIGNFNHGYDGQWTTYLRYILYNRYMSMPKRDDVSYKDILGYVDSDIEIAAQRGYLRNA